MWHTSGFTAAAACPRWGHHFMVYSLRLAKAMVEAGHADLYEDGAPICSMELVAETGVWLVGKPRRAERLTKL